MAEISKITLPSGNTYDIKDATARSEIEQIIKAGLTYKVVSTLPTASADTIGIVYLVPHSHGTNDVYDEYLTIKGGTATSPTYSWEKIGNTDIDLSNYAQKGAGITVTSGSAANAKTNITIADHTITQGSFTGSFTGSQKQVSVTGKPEGSVTISKGTGTANYTPEGTVSAPTITVTPSTTTVYSITAVGTLPTFTEGEFSQGTLPSLTTTVANEVLTIGFSQGTLPTKAADTFTQGSLPTKGSGTSVVSGIASATSTQPTFTGTGAELKASFSGNNMTSTGNYTPEGSIDGSITGFGVSKHSVTDNGHTHSVTGSGTINS